MPVDGEHPEDQRDDDDPGGVDRGHPAAKK